VETVSVYGFERGLSRKNAEQLVLDGCARWCSYKTIELIGDPSPGVHKRIKKKPEQDSIKSFMQSPKSPKYRGN